VKALVVISEIPPIVSGVANCGARLVEGLRARGHDVDVEAAPEIPRWIVGEFRFSGFVRRWGSVRRRFDGYDVINLHGPTPSLSDAFLALSQTVSPMRRPPIVYTHHSFLELDGLRGASAAYNRLHARLMRVADRIVVTSDSYRKIVAAATGRDAEVVPWGVDYERFASEPLPREESQPLRILFVGQMRPYKGVENLVRAVAGSPELSLTIVGGGSLAPDVARLVQQLGVDNITYRGRVPDEELPGEYARHHVIALPSLTRAEAYGLVLLEGMAAGCVPLGSDLPGVRDVVDGTGLVVPPGDVDALRRSLLELAADDGLRLRLANASIERMRALTWDGVVAGYERILEDAVQGAQARLAVRALSASQSSPEDVLGGLRLRFGASRASLLLFGDRSPGGAPVPLNAWGPYGHDHFVDAPPVIARYVADRGEGVLLGGEHTPSDVRDLLRREHVASALAIPIRTPRGPFVLNLSIDRDESDRRFTPGDLREAQRWVA
jgi:glycosyltransferase involved in cell wall biosynthesis